MSASHWERLERQERWMAQYGLCASKARQCLRWVAGSRCRCYCLSCDKSPQGRLGWFDHTFAYLGADSRRLLITQPYGLLEEHERSSIEAARAHGVHVMVHHDLNSAWWFPGTRLIVFSNAPIPEHGYRYGWDVNHGHRRRH